MSKEPRGLGKGLSALLSDAPMADQLRKPVGYVNKDISSPRSRQDAPDVLRIPLDAIEANPFQPRGHFDEEALEELAASIRELGLIQPITVRRAASGKYQIISGERRFRASRKAGLADIPAYVRDTDDRGMLEMAIVENIQREDLDPIEEALSYQRLIDECSLTQEAMAARVGKKRLSVTNKLRLLRLPPKVQHQIKTGELSVGHAKVILGVEGAALQEQLADKVVAEDLSVRALEGLIRSGVSLKKEKAPKEPQELPEEYYKVLGRLGKYFSRDISLKRASDGKGTMTIRFNSDEEMGAFLKALEDSQI